MNSPFVIVCILFYFVIIIALSLSNKASKGIKNNYLNLIKPFIPSWKFYDDFEENRLLFFRAQILNEEFFCEWTPLYQTPKSDLKSLFINHQGNLILAAQSHVQTLVHDISEHDDKTPFQHTLTYKITNNLVRYALKKKFNKAFKYQFKLAVVNERAEVIEDILISPLYDGGEQSV